MVYLVTAALVVAAVCVACAACLALTLDGVIADQWHVVGYVRGVPFPRMPTCNGVFIGMLTCGLVALIVEMRWAIYIHAMRVASLIGCKLNATRRIVDWTRFY